MRQTTEIQTVSHGAGFSLLLFNVFVTLRVWRHSRVCLDLVVTENGVRLRLNIVDTPGYGDQVNNENWCVTGYFPVLRERMLTGGFVGAVAGTQL